MSCLKIIERLMEIPRDNIGVSWSPWERRAYDCLSRVVSRESGLERKAIEYAVYFISKLSPQDAEKLHEYIRLG